MHISYRRPALALLGFSAFGAALASSLVGSAQSALLTPVAAALALASLLPLLYVVATLIGLAPPLRDMLRIGTSSFQDVGIALLGLAPAAAFLRPVAPWLVIAPSVFLAYRIATLSFARRTLEVQQQQKNPLIVHVGIGAWMSLVCVMTISLLDKWF